MVRKLLGVAVLGLMLAGCSSAPLGPESESSQEESVGSINLPLLAKVGDVTYRLRLATFTIVGPALGGRPRVVKPLADALVHNEVLPLGAYAITLEKGWVLERKGPLATDVYTTIPAQLVTPNPLDFDVNGKIVADAFFGFATSSGDVSFGSGSVDIHIGVRDCSAFNGYTAALGTLTANCLGTVDPRNFSLSPDGYLVPNFNACPLDDKAQTMIHSIRRLLSLQYKTAFLPFAKACMAGRYEVALAKFNNSGIEACPQWKWVMTENPITFETIDQVSKLLPQKPSPSIPPEVYPLLKENNLYNVFYEQEPPGQKCQGAHDCGTQCAAVFPGFVLGEGKDPNGGPVLRTDPDAWTIDKTFATAAQDPFLRATYYHPMSSANGGPPGVQFGDYTRFAPCVGTGCMPEQCSFWTGQNEITRLQAHCNNYMDPDTCTSYCGPLLSLSAGVTAPAL